MLERPVAHSRLVECLCEGRTPCWHLEHFFPLKWRPEWLRGADAADLNHVRWPDGAQWFEVEQAWSRLLDRWQVGRNKQTNKQIVFAII